MDDQGLHSPSRLFRPHVGLALWGIPLTERGIEIAIEHLVETLWDSQDPSESIDRLKEQVGVSDRWGPLMAFSTITVALSIFVANNRQLLPTIWQHAGFYLAMAVWVASVLRLLWSLRQELPDAWELGTEVHFRMVGRMCLRTAARFNLLVIANAVCFGSMVALLMPISPVFKEVIF